MTAFRNNGIKFNSTQLQPHEVLGLMEHTASRVRSAGEEMAYLTGLALDLGLLPSDQIMSLEDARRVEPTNPEVA